MRLKMKTMSTLLMILLLASMTSIAVPVQAPIIDNSPYSWIDHTDTWNPFTIRRPDLGNRIRDLTVVISDLAVSGDLYVGNTITLSGTVDMTADAGISWWWIHCAWACSYGTATLTGPGPRYDDGSPLKWAYGESEGGSSGWWDNIIPNDQSQTWAFSFDYDLTEAGTYTLTAFGHVDAGYWRQHYDSGHPGLEWKDSDNQADSIQFEVLSHRDVDIDIKPGSDPNSINPDSQGLLPVAIFGSDTFDVTQIDLDTIALGGIDLASRGSAKAPKLACSYEYVNDDGFMDLMTFFPIPELSLDPGDTALTLTALLDDTTPIAGTDSIRVVPLV